MSTSSTTDSAPQDRRKDIFARIREALTSPAKPVHEKRPVLSAGVAPESTFPQWLPAVGKTTDEHVVQFAQNSLELKTEFKTFASLDEAGAYLKRLATENGWKMLATHRAELTDAIASMSGVTVYHADVKFNAATLEACDASLTGCEALVAQTGSICVTNQSSGGRALSILPPHHVVMARRSQLLSDLPSVYAMLKNKYAATGYPSMISFITGPSRTGDIERILVLGAHGPKKLTVLLVS